MSSADGARQGTGRRGVLFACVANSARSQMAEGLARQHWGPDTPVWSAGSAPTRPNPHALAVLAELGIEMPDPRSKSIAEIPMDRVRTVVTLCAEEVCPVVPGDVERLHWPLPDPAAATGTEEEVRDAFRRVRDELARRLAAWEPARR